MMLPYLSHCFISELPSDPLTIAHPPRLTVCELRLFGGHAMKMKSQDQAKAFNLYDLPDGFLDDPFPWYHALRVHHPAHTLPDGSILLTRYTDCMEIYRNPQTFISDKKVEFGAKFGDSPLYLHHTTSLVFNDPPLHTRVRKLLAPAFTPRAVTRLEPVFVDMVEDLLDKAADQGGFDLIEDFASALPVWIIGDLLGIPREERGPLRDWSLAILGALEPVIDEDQTTAGNTAVTEFSDYLSGLIEDRRQNPGDEQDVLTALIHGEFDGDRLSLDELVQNCVFLLNAGHETTTNLIGNGVDALLRFPDQKHVFLNDPACTKSAIEEFLRYESSNQLGNRKTVQDVDVGGVSIAAGTYIHLCIGAANRDPEIFPDPDELNINRSPNRHLAFGGGIHNCAGNSLARMEGAIAIRRLFDRFPDLRLDGTPVRGGRARFRGFLKYPIVF